MVKRSPLFLGLIRPARVLGLAGEAGSLTAGALADLLVVGEDLRLEAVMRRGEWISGDPPR